MIKVNESNPQKIRSGVFWPSFLVVGGAALLGIFNNKMLADVAMNSFLGSLRSLGWLYQIISIVALILVTIITFSKLGNIRFGGDDAKPKYPFITWFAMALTGGIATGVITYGVNEPIIYFGNIYGEMAQTGVETGTPMAAIYALARCFYNWTFIPYAMYSLCGLVVAYMYFNKKKPLSVTSTLIPLFGEKVTDGIWANIIDTLALLAIALGLASSLGAGLALVSSGIEAAYGIPQGIMVWLILAIITTATFTLSSLMGIDKGIKWLSDLNSKVFYLLLIFLFLIGPTLYILRMSTAGMAYWLQNFWIWGLDPIDMGGEALVMWWTLYDWAIWIAYAPLMGLFLAIISYGRTIRQFMVINWILPSIFSIIWFGVWGATALQWQQQGSVDLIKTITDSGAVAGLWAFLGNLPLGAVIIPIIMLTLILSFSTAADSMTRTIASLCTANMKHDEEPPRWQKLLWGLSIGVIAFVMVAYAGGSQGVDGVKYLAAAGGSLVLFVFVLQVISAIKMFFFDKIER
ncbi:choline-glycine betaine transporter [Anaerosolibacter carboniphilus]|uniref:Choline-glycine betaine transporter n=1 Tax=Anaerosolibacter carboniphilus TaxID=1417629 RepID=A0A841KUB8_9FIRM|nr:BCCT family transporter [Anaerosolibacter carboniphilus]MBB6217304.1 choline-glycine betaine transporter [Anaerosolibacter carboniphilus]